MDLSKEDAHEVKLLALSSRLELLESAWLKKFPECKDEMEKEFSEIFLGKTKEYFNNKRGADECV